MYLSKEKFGGSVFKTLGEQVLQIGQYSNDVFLLESDGTLSVLTYSSDSVTTHTVATDVAYADGAADFAVYVQRDGTLFCTSAKGICPQTDGLKNRVHEVASANAESITFQLRSGELYYYYNGVWIFDNEAVQIGVLNGSVYRLTRQGILFKNGIEDARNVEHIVITDTEITYTWRVE